MAKFSELYPKLCFVRKFHRKKFKKITQLLHISKIRYNFALAKGEEQCPAANCLVV